MATAILAVAATAAGGLASGLVGGGVIGAVVGAAVTVGVSYLGSALIGTPDPPTPTPSTPTTQTAPAAIANRTQMVVQPVTSHRIVYGRVRVGGPLAFVHAWTPPGSSRRDILHLAVVHAAHQVDGYEALYLDERVVPLDPASGAATAAPWTGDGGAVYVHAWRWPGTADQPTDGSLIAESDGRWTPNHCLRGRAWSHVRAAWREDLFSGGVPNVSALLRGRLVWDPRDGATRWSANAALCVLDYLTAPWGLGAGLGEIDTAAWIAQANICDEAVATLSGTEPRYTCNGVLDLAARPLDNLESLLTSCAGRLTFTGGKWRLAVGAWQSPTVTLGESQLRAPVTYRPWLSRRGLVNTVRGAFTSPDASWQTTDYPPVSDPAAVTADGGEAALTLDLPFTTSASMAQRIARIALRQNRRQKSLDWPANLVGLRVAAGHPVAVTLDRLGLAGTTFRVETWRMSDDMGVDLALAEDGSEVYAHDPSWLRSM